MKTCLIFLLAAASIVLSGCGAAHAEPAQANATAPAATYKAGNGIQLSPGARELAGLKLADAAERPLGAGARATAIPVAALVRTVKGDFVYVANGPWFLRTAVTIGITDGEWAQVADGLYEGDTVVSHGARTLWLAELQAINGGVGCADGK
ncbi:MAG: hypothetical protein HYV95_09925 [Opitutae bacterium]|nr:hypothetical protein [Opitutae bacterium]